MKHLSSTQMKNLTFLKRFVLVMVMLSVVKYTSGSIAASPMVSKVKAVIQIGLI